MGDAQRLCERLCTPLHVRSTGAAHNFRAATRDRATARQLAGELGSWAAGAAEGGLLQLQPASIDGARLCCEGHATEERKRHEADETRMSIPRRARSG